VDPCHVHPRIDEGLDLFGGLGGGSDGAYDLGSAHGTSLCPWTLLPAPPLSAVTWGRGVVVTWWRGRFLTRLGSRLPTRLVLPARRLGVVTFLLGVTWAVAG